MDQPVDSHRKVEVLCNVLAVDAKPAEDMS